MEILIVAPARKLRSPLLVSCYSFCFVEAGAKTYFCQDFKWLSKVSVHSNPKSQLKKAFSEAEIYFVKIKKFYIYNTLPLLKHLKCRNWLLLTPKIHQIHTKILISKFFFNIILYLICRSCFNRSILKFLSGSN